MRSPKPMVPNKVDKIEYVMPDVNHTFMKGHRIMVQVQSTWFPLVDRNPQKFVNIYKAGDSRLSEGDPTRVSLVARHLECVEVESTDDHALTPSRHGTVDAVAIDRLGGHRCSLLFEARLCGCI